MGFKKLLHGIIIKTIESAVQKLGIADHIVKQFLWFTGIGNIAPSLACNINFLTQLFIFSKRVTLWPFPAAASAAIIPAAPPPTTKTLLMICSHLRHPPHAFLSYIYYRRVNQYFLQPFCFSVRDASGLRRLPSMEGMARMVSSSIKLISSLT